MSFGQEVGTAVKNGLCAALAAGNAIEDFVRTVLNPNDPNYSYRGRLIYSRYCEQPPPPPTAPPFEGGQCPVKYSVQATITDRTLDGEERITVQSGLYWGEIGGLSYGPATNGAANGALFISCYGSANGTDPRLPNAVSIKFTETIFPAIRFKELLFSNVTVTRVDGLPDDCGDPPTELPPDDPSKRKFPIDFNFDYNDGTDFNIKGDIYFGLAYFDNDFNLNVPLKFVLDNDVQFNADFNFNTGDININFGGDNNYPSPPPPEGDYRPDNDTPPPPPTVEPPPPGFEPPYPPNDDPDEEDSEDFDDEQPPIGKTIRRMIGVLVDTTVVPRMPSQIEQEENPVVYAPDIGLVNFAYIIGGNRLYWGEDVRVKNRRQVIFTPEGRYAADVRGTIRQGGQWVLTPIYARVPEDSVFTP